MNERLSGTLLEPEDLQQLLAIAVSVRTCARIAGEFPDSYSLCWAASEDDYDHIQPDRHSPCRPLSRWQR